MTTTDYLSQGHKGDRRSIIDPPTPAEMGTAAYHANQSRSACPFEVLSDEAVAWLEAYDFEATCDEEGLATNLTADDLGDDCDEFGGFMGPAYQGSKEQIYFSGPGNGLDRTCGGTGVLDCHCGGDLCVCGWHGEAECFGCVDCEDLEDDMHFNEDEPFGIGH